MKSLSLFLMFVAICFAFIAEDNPEPIDPTLIVGKWQLEKTLLDGEVDTTRAYYSTIIYTFRSNDSATIQLVTELGDTSAYNGTYHIRAKHRILTTKFDGASGGDELIQELTIDTLVFYEKFRRKGYPRRIETYYTRIK